MQSFEIRTPRLTLRPFIESDWRLVHDYNADPQVVRYMRWGPNREADTIAFVSRAIANSTAAPRTEFDFAVVRSEDDALIGNCNLRLTGDAALEGTIGYLFHPDHWGNGFATETVEALLQHGFEHLGLHRIVANCHSENLASQRVLEKNGMRLEAHFRRQTFLRGGWVDMYLYAMLKEEWGSPQRRAVIFDMDGVLADTEPIYLNANLQVFERLGITVSQERYNEFIGVSAQRMWEELKREHHLPEPVEILVRREAEAGARSLIRSDLAPMPGVLALIEQLEAERVPMAVASSSSHRVIRIILSKIGLLAKFKAVVSGNDVRNGKPAPDIFLLAARRLGVSPAGCIVIEDSGHGVRGAKAAGMRCIGFIGAHDSRQDLSPADLIFRGFEEDAYARLAALSEEAQ